jgi:hypothetical protein
MMNERILELNAQADKYAWEKVGKKYDGAGDLNWKWEDTKMEKFAELIVGECVEVCNGQATYDPQTLPYKPSEQFADAIKEHFGVEE